MTDHTELLVLILPPQGRLVVAAADSAGLLPGPGLVLALEHKSAAGSQTVAGLLDRDRVRQLYHALADWLTGTDPAVQRRAAARPTVESDGMVTESTVAQWLASGAEQLPLEGL
jgi:hypothetical protein